MAVQRMMAVALDASGAEPAFGRPAALFADEYDFGQGTSIANYDMTRDGRFIMLRRSPHGSSLRSVINWTEELKQILRAAPAELVFVLATPERCRRLLRIPPG